MPWPFVIYDIFIFIAPGLFLSFIKMMHLIAPWYGLWVYKSRALLYLIHGGSGAAKIGPEFFLLSDRGYFGDIPSMDALVSWAVIDS